MPKRDLEEFLMSEEDLVRIVREGLKKIAKTNEEIDKVPQELIVQTKQKKRSSFENVESSIIAIVGDIVLDGIIDSQDLQVGDAFQYTFRVAHPCHLTCEALFALAQLPNIVRVVVSAIPGSVGVLKVTLTWTSDQKLAIFYAKEEESILKDKKGIIIMNEETSELSILVNTLKTFVDIDDSDKSNIETTEKTIDGITLVVVTVDLKDGVRKEQIERVKTITSIKDIVIMPHRSKPKIQMSISFWKLAINSQIKGRASNN